LSHTCSHAEYGLVDCLAHPEEHAEIPLLGHPRKAL